MALTAAVCVSRPVASQPNQPAEPANVSPADSARACQSDTVERVPGRLTGRTVRVVHVVTEPPRSLPGPASLVNGAHFLTQPGTIRRELLFAPADTLDTLRVAESLRRLRAARYLSDVALVTRQCGASGPVDLTVVTRDVWSTRPTVSWRGAGTTLLGVEETNLFGTGRRLKAYVRRDPPGRLGLGAAYVDPALLGGRAVGLFAHSAFRDGSEWVVAGGRRERSVFDAWQLRATALRLSLRSVAPAFDTVSRISGALYVGRRVAASPDGATFVGGGVELDEAYISAPFPAPVIGARRLRRRFVGLDLGVERRAAAYAATRWYLPYSAIQDVPLGVESQAVIGVGRDLATGAPALHADAWAGRQWLADSGHVLLTTGVWGSGFASGWGRRWSAASVRALAQLDRAAWRGRWTVQLGGQRLMAPDPDVRSPVVTDRTAPALGPDERLAALTVAASAERTLHLTGVHHAYVLDAAAFGAASLRRDLPTRPGFLPVAVGGVGLRMTPARVGRATFRLDVGVPVVAGGALLGGRGAARRPFVAVSVGRPFEVLRRRDGLRAP